MTRDVNEYVKKCEKCQKNKFTRGTKMILSGVSKLPFERVYVDIVGPLPETKYGNCRYGQITTVPNICNRKRNI